MVLVVESCPYRVGDHLQHHNGHHDAVVKYLVSLRSFSHHCTILERRTEHNSLVLHLKGRLDLLTRQARNRQEDTVVDKVKKYRFSVCQQEF